METEDITNKTQIKWGGGYIATKFKCECGEEIIAYTRGDITCKCGKKYWLATRLMMSTGKTKYAHDCECDCSECTLERAEYQTNFENKHNH